MSDVTDPLDMAANVSEQLRSAAEQATRQAARPEVHPDFDGVHCVEDACGVEIPAERIKHGRVRCVDCQDRIEQQRKVGGFAR